MKEEVDTLPILKQMFKDDKDCFIPNYKGSEMIMVPLKSWEDYEKLPVTKWGIKQPSDFDLAQDASKSGINESYPVVEDPPAFQLTQF